MYPFVAQVQQGVDDHTYRVDTSLPCVFGQLLGTIYSKVAPVFPDRDTEVPCQIERGLTRMVPSVVPRKAREPEISRAVLGVLRYVAIAYA